jgi:ketosteroid isomerase-like protein
MPLAKNDRKDVAEIERLTDAWSRALERKDVDGMLHDYADDVVLFDVRPPWKTVGVPGYRAVWEQCLPHLPDRLVSKRRDVRIEVSGDVAFAFGLHTFEPSPTWVRFTVCFRRVDGAWQVVHEHVSIPFDPRTGQAVLITSPDAPPSPSAA